MNTYLHIGLHKTGSTFLQNIFSKNLNRNMIVYNPRDVVFAVEYAIDNPAFRERYIQKAKDLVDTLSRDSRTENIFISNENLSQRFCLQDYEECAQVLKEVFPDAKIILFLRFQPDWILSCYKQSIQLDDPQDVKSFLSYRNAKFEESDSRFNKAGLLSFDIHKTDWANLLNAYLQRFGQRNVYVYFYEDLKNDPKSVIDDIGDLIGVKMILSKKRGFSNKSFSALACRMTIYRFNTYRFLGLERFLPISVKPYIEKILLTPPQLNDDDKIGSKPFLSWEEAKASLSFTALIPVFFAKAYKRIMGLKDLRWRGLWQRYLDRAIYVDWDLLEEEGIRGKLETYYRRQNLDLLKYIPVDKIPEKYLEQKLLSQKIIEPGD